MRDARGRSRRPRPLGDALGKVLDQVAPQTPLAAVQTAWPEVVGAQIAAVTTVVEEHDGTVVVDCESAVWAQELEMMSPQLIANLASRMGDSTPEKLRFRVAN